jgi:ABC-2 type transport system ATP-binding protein
MIRVHNLKKRFGPVLAVDGISFTVQEGEIVGVLGPNGAGKTTTIRILTCYIPATSGSASVAGFDVFDHSMEVRRQVGYLPESTPLYPELRVREYLHFRGKLRGMDAPSRERAVGRVTERCWLGDFVDRPIGHLSKGMRQRVGLADAIMHDPAVLVLDEPTIGLDPAQIRETRNLIKELGERHTILLCTHILPEVEQLCTRTIILASGKIVASGAPAELREKLTAEARVVAEIKGPAEDIRKGVGALEGVSGLDVMVTDGWVRLHIEAGPHQDVREAVVNLSHERGWPLREIRREGATLEDFFVQVTAEQHERSAGR